MTQEQKFPIVDALLLTPEEGLSGSVGICTNTSAPGQVFNEIAPENRNGVSVLGSLVVSRDGSERMILNCLAHPNLSYLILFSEESLTFSPSTNLLQAIVHGLDSERKGNFIQEGVAASAHYPNLSKNILDKFRENIIVLPLFIYQSAYTKQIIEDYLKWLAPKIPESLYSLLTKINNSKKIYYDALNEVLILIKTLPKKSKEIVHLDAREFQHLQPPKIILAEIDTKPEVPFLVENMGGQIKASVKISNSEIYEIVGDNDFLIAYSLMEALGDKKSLLSPREQLLLGAELARVSTEIANSISVPSIVIPVSTSPDLKHIKVPLVSQTKLIMDQKYYYKISSKDGSVSVLCMAFDVCEEVFDLRAKKVVTLIDKLAKNNRFELYAMDILHRVDVGIQIARASIATELGYSFIQDFSSIFKINTTNLPFLIIDGDSFLGVHKSVLTKIYTEGITEEHGDKQKGLARTASILAIYRNAPVALETMPMLYKQGENTPDQIRLAYKAQLLRFDHDGSYSYGERTRSFFGFDQLQTTAEALRKNPNRVAIVQRFDPSVDMGMYIDKDSGKNKFTHDPCLTHDLFFILDGRLHSFHIARAHNIVNAYPENIFGLFDAYVTPTAETLGLRIGDMCMLSNRANILLITEEQRAKKIIGEPSKPVGNIDSSVGPNLIGEGYAISNKSRGIFVNHQSLIRNSSKPESFILNSLENYNNCNTINRAINYLKDKGVMHNNPILSQYRAGESDPQSECLVFFQANVLGGKLHVTAVFANRSHDNLVSDSELCNYVATLYQNKLSCQLGDLTIFYVS